MRSEDRDQTAALLANLIRSEHIAEYASAYGGAGEDAAIQRALALFIGRPELGFAWLVLENSSLVGVATVCFAVSTNLGAIVAKVPDFVVAPDARSNGIGVERIDLGVHETNEGARRFYDRLGFVANHELGLSLVL